LTDKLHNLKGFYVKNNSRIKRDVKVKDDI